MIFRFDDVCINSDMELHNRMTDYLLRKFKCEIIWAVSVGVIGQEGQRVFPKRFNAYSDYRYFFELDKIAVPQLRGDVKLASHGLFHVDHRLLSAEAQVISITTSVSLLNYQPTLFVPPFNKYNSDTETICTANDLKLIKWEDGWLSMEYNKYNSSHDKYYLHAREWTFEKFKSWFEK